MRYFQMSWVLVLCVNYVRTFESTGWQALQERLHEKIKEIFESEKHIKVTSGKYFNYTLAGNSNYEVYERSTKQLPKWLLFNVDKNNLHGFPTDTDLKHDVVLEIRKREENPRTGFSAGTETLQLDRKSIKEPFSCNLEETTVASVIFHTDIKNFDADYRFHFLLNFAFAMGLSINDLRLYEGNRMESDLNAMNLRKAGPGDKVHGKQPGITVSWRVTCGRDIAGNAQLAKLAELTENENFKSVLHQPVLGWFVTTSNSRSRRALNGVGTPGTGASKLSNGGGTPTLGPSPSVSVMATQMLKPIPTKSSSIMRMTSTVVIQPVTTTTERTSTTKRTTPTKEQTTKPQTTNEVTTDSQTTKSKPTVVTVIPGNHAPVVKNGLDIVTVFAGQALDKELPVDLFEDSDGDTLSIAFEFYPDGMDHPKIIVPDDYWIAYKNKKLYVLPPSDFVKENRTFEEVMFTLTATDPKGLSAIDVFSVRVHADSNVYNNLFNITLDLSFDEYKKDVEKRVGLVRSLANGMVRELSYDINYTDLRSLNFLSGSVVVVWGVSTESPDLKGCNNVNAETYSKDLQSGKFKEYLLINANIHVVSAGMVSKTECLIIPASSGSDGSGLWERILIPVIVVVVILLIIAIVLCCIYRRKKKYEPAREVDGGDDYFSKQNGKKPVIFLEEYEDKQDFISLQPLILPNEKPPVQQAYEPRADTPEGPSSGSGSTDSEEKGLLGSPKEQRTGFINAPPPYSSNN